MTSYFQYPASTLPCWYFRHASLCSLYGNGDQIWGFAHARQALLAELHLQPTHFHFLLALCPCNVKTPSNTWKRQRWSEPSHPSSGHPKSAIFQTLSLSINLFIQATWTGTAETNQAQLRSEDLSATPYTWEKIINAGCSRSVSLKVAYSLASMRRQTLRCVTSPSGRHLSIFAPHGLAVIMGGGAGGRGAGDTSCRTYIH